jgi:L-amino acid N-acyltransferase YncA
MSDATRPEVGVRTAGMDDLPEIVRIYNQAVDEQATADIEPVSIDERRSWLEAHREDSHPALIAERDGRVVGFASLSPHRPGRGAVRHTAEVSYYVDARARGHGVATALLDASLSRCGGLGIEVVFAIVLDDNAPSLALLEQQGFERWGHLPAVARFGERSVGHVYMGRRVAEEPC